MKKNEKKNVIKVRSFMMLILLRVCSLARSLHASQGEML